MMRPIMRFAVLFPGVLLTYLWLIFETPALLWQALKEEATNGRT